MGLGQILVFALRALQFYKGQKSISEHNFHSFMYYIYICTYVSIYVCISYNIYAFKVITEHGIMEY